MSAVSPAPRPLPPQSGARRGRRLPLLLAGSVVAALAVSAWEPHDRATWFLETVWVIAGLPLLFLTWRRFPMTGLLCCLLAAHALVLVVGGHYTYAQVPLGDWVRDTLGLERNPYDRFGHLMQGFVPAILVRELLVRTSPLRGSRWLAPLTVCACLAFSAVFEMLEWAAAVIGGGGGRLPGHTGRCVGHAVGHVLRPRRRHRLAPPAQPAPRPAPARAGASVTRVAAPARQ
ncbi:hypothetical protein GCM10020295_06450 [Streptomyces cinereospinus]